MILSNRGGVSPLFETKKGDLRKREAEKKE